MISGNRRQQQRPTAFANATTIPTPTTGHEDAWYEGLDHDGLDLVSVFTHYQARASMSIEAMDPGNHIATEIPATRTIEECEALAAPAERTRKHFVMLENVNYCEEELWVLSMVDAGVFGELNYAKDGCVHAHFFYRF